MREVKRISLSLIVCIVGLAAFMLVMETPSSAGSSGSWQYTILDTGDIVIDAQLTEAEINEAEKRGVEKARSIEDKLNRLGADGWELVVYTGRTAIFKRPG